MVNPRGFLLSVGLSNPEFGICGKAWRGGLGLGPSDLSLDYSKACETSRRKIPHGVGGELRWHPCLFLA